MDRYIGFKNFISELSKPREFRKGFIRKRKIPFSISGARINELYETYFFNLTPKHKKFSFNANPDDFHEIVYLLRVHFQLWIEIEGNSITIFPEFPECFKLTQEVSPENHWFIPKSLPKGTILYYGEDHYGVCNRMKGIPLSEEPPNAVTTGIRPVIQINYEFISVFED